MPWLATGVGQLRRRPRRDAGGDGDCVAGLAACSRGRVAARGVLPRRAGSGAAGHGDVGGAPALPPADGLCPHSLPLVQQSGTDFGFHWLGAPHWSAVADLLQGNGLLQLQLLFLDGGLLLSLYLAWRMAAGRRAAERLLAVAPLALLTVALYAFGFWVLLQPMQMRGVMMGAM